MAVKIRKWKRKTKIALAAIISLVCAVAGLFLFFGEKRHFGGDGSRIPDTLVPHEHEQSGGNGPLPVVYRCFSEATNGIRQQVNLLEIDLSGGRAEVMPALSHDKIYGFEKLSQIVKRSEAYAAVNGGFFDEYGQPAGMVVINGSLIKKATGRYPVFIVNEDRAALMELNTEVWIEVGNGEKLPIDAINEKGNPGETVVYTPVYGSTNRAGKDNITVTVSGGAVVKIAGYDREASIPEDGMLVTFYLPSAYSFDTIPLKVGQTPKMEFAPDMGDGASAYECGSWIVRNGKIVMPERDEWIGVTTNRDPRTAVGLKDEKTVILITVDGRQPEYSAGLTGKELGELLVRLGVKDAAMLDGGASTEMIVEGEIVNRPSFKGQERPLGGAVIVKIK